MGGRRCRHNFEFDSDLVFHADGAPGDFDGRDAIVGLLQAQRSAVLLVVERYGCCNLRETPWILSVPATSLRLFPKAFTEFDVKLIAGNWAPSSTFGPFMVSSMSFRSEPPIPVNKP